MLRTLIEQLTRKRLGSRHGRQRRSRRMAFQRGLSRGLRIESLEDRNLLATLMVTNTDDSGTGSLRQAIEDVGPSAGVPDEIHFNIPGAGPHTIQPLSDLPQINFPVIIDGTTEPDFAGSPVIELDGSLVGTSGFENGITLSADGSTIRGLVINRFPNSGIEIGSNNNAVEGNFIGTDFTGTAALPNGGGGVVVSGAQNRIGTNGDGVDDAAERNVISGNSSAGVRLFGAGANNNVVAGNFIGTDVTGTSALANFEGIVINAGPQQNRIGGATNAEANLIAFNQADGIHVNDATSTGNHIQRNSIHSNGGLSIDLNNDGVTLNDPGDGDSGANNLQNFPVITALTVISGNTTIDGTLNSTPNSQFTLEFFRNTAADPSGFGEGQTFIGETRVTTDGTGNVSFMPTFTADLGLGEFITATATDQGGNTSEFSAAFEHTNNRNPVAVDDAISTDEDTAISGDVLAANPTTPDSDPDGNGLSVIEVNGSTVNVDQQITLASGALLTLNATGTFSYDPDGGFDALVSGAVGMDNFTYRISDGRGGTDTGTVNVTITGLNDAPVLAVIGNQVVNEQATLNFTATATDPDKPAQSLTFSLDAAAITAGMSIDAASGEFSFTPTEAQGGMVFNATITVTDNGANPATLSDSETINITVNEVNVVPVLTAIGNQTVDEQMLLTFTATATDQDDPVQNLTFSLDAAAITAGMSIDADTGAFSFTPTESQGGMTFDATITVTDDGLNAPNLTDFETITVTVNEVNVTPVLAAIGNQTVDEQTMLTFTATATDQDLPAQTLTFSLNSAAIAAGMTIEALTGAFSFAPTELQGGMVLAATITVTDSGTNPPNLRVSETINITVNEANVAPTLTEIGNQTVDEEATLNFTATATDQDDPAQNLIFSLDSAAIAAGMTINPTTGAFSFAPIESQGGMVFNATISVTDDGTNLPTLTDSETIEITVNEVNVAPMLAAIGDQTVDEQSPLNFTATATDQDEPVQNLTFSLDAAAITAGMSIDADTGVFSFMPTESQGGMTFDATITVTDDGTNLPTLTDFETISITVTEVNVAPVLDAIGNQTVDKLATLSFQANATDVDAPANALTFSLSGAVPTGAGITSAGAFSWTPTGSQGPGMFTFDVVVTDNGTPNLSDTETITITVEESPAIAVADVSVAEGGGLLFTVTLDKAVQGGFTVDVTLADVTATGGAAPLVFPEDYDNVVAQLNFSGTAGETQQLTVATLDDMVVESTETFTVSLSSSSPLVDDSDTAIGTIADDDFLLVEFDQDQGTDRESSGGNLPQLLVTGTVPAGQSVTIDVMVVGGTATGGGVDYNDPTTVTVAAGTYNATAVAITELSVIPDALIEPDETIDLGTLTGSQFQVGDANGDGTTQATTQYTIEDDNLQSVRTVVALDNASILTITDIVPGGKEDQLELTIVDGDLVITERNSSNIIGDLTDNTTGVVVDVPLASILGLVIDLFEGDDQLSINFKGAPQGFNLPVTINGGDGHDTLTFTGETVLDAGELRTNDEVEDVSVNGPIMIQNGTIMLEAVQSLEINADIAIGTGSIQLTAGRDVFGNCSLVQAGDADVHVLSGTGIANVRVETTGDVTLDGGSGGIVGCSGQMADAIAVSAIVLTLQADASVGTALLLANQVTNESPFLTSVESIQGTVGGLGIFLTNDGPLTDNVELVEDPPMGLRHVCPGPECDLSEGEGSPAQNRVNRLDVNDDGAVSPVDALVIVNHLDAGQTRAESEGPNSDRAKLYVDVNGDFTISALDALIVINYLNSRTVVQAEGELTGVNRITSYLNASTFDRGRARVSSNTRGLSDRDLSDRGGHTSEAFSIRGVSQTPSYRARQVRPISLQDDEAARQWESLLDDLAEDAAQTIKSQGTGV